MLHDGDLLAITARLLVATVVGLGIGFEREYRGHDAGLRTHALVALSSAMITLSSLLLFDEVKANGGSGDPLRAVQGLAQAIGFIAGGLIFIRRGDVRNMTTAASLWMASAAGIGAGAGQFGLVGISAAIALILLLIDIFLPRFNHRGPKPHDAASASSPNRRGSAKID